MQKKGGDETAPIVVSSSIEPGLANADSEVRVSVTFDEALGVDPSCVVDFGQGETIQLELRSVESAAYRYLFVYAPSGHESSGDHLVKVSAGDAFGNSAVLEVGRLAFDFVDPEILGLTWDTTGSVPPDAVLGFAATTAPDVQVVTASLLDQNDRVLGFPGAVARLDDSGSEAVMQIDGQVSLGLFDLTGVSSIQIELWVEDQAGNVAEGDSIRTSKLVINTAAPDTQIDSAPALDADALMAAFQFSSVDADVVGFECNLDDEGFVPCSSPYSQELGATGAHRFEVRAVDEVGHVDASPATWEWNETRRWYSVATSTRLGSERGTTCAIATDGSLWCWGNNSGGQIGLGFRNTSITQASATPKRVGYGRDWRSIVGGQSGFCGARSDGAQGQERLYCWGYASGWGGSLPRELPTLILEPEGWTHLAGGMSSFCGLKQDQSLWCWGKAPVGSDEALRSPAQIGSLSWLDVDVGYRHGCGVQTDQTLWCWGESPEGQAGPATSSVPVRIGSDADWIDIGAGHHHSCGLRAVGEERQLWCWGRFGGEVGPTVRRIGTGTTWQEIQSVGRSTCVRDEDTSLSCFSESDGPTFPGTWHSAADTEGRFELPAWERWAAARRHVCGIINGSLECRGSDSEGQLGAGYLIRYHSEYGPVGGQNADWVTLAGGWTSTCGIREAAALRTAWCWGYRASAGGVIPDGTKALDWPTQAGSATTWATISVSRAYTCGLLQDSGESRAACFGSGMTAPEATLVSADVDWVAVDAGNAHICGIRAAGNGSLFCWGSGNNGKLGTGSTSSESAPTLIAESHWVSVSAGDEHTCGIQEDGGNRTLWCWGEYNRGRLGIAGATADVLVPTQVGSGADWLVVQACGSTSCGLRGTSLPGELWCWGYNQVESGTDAWTPIQLGSDDDWQGLPGCFRALKPDGTVWQWLWGEASLSLVSGLAPVDAIGLNQSSTCVLRDGQVLCQGSNDVGQLGDGTAWGPVVVAADQK